MNTNPEHCAGCRHDDEPLNHAEKAMITIISLTLHPASLNQLSVLMDIHDAMTVAAFALFHDGVTFAERSLIEQFDHAYIDTFATWDRCARHITEFVHRDARWIRKQEQKTGRPFADLLATGDEIIQDLLRGHGLVVIDTGDKIALFHRSTQ